MKSARLGLALGLTMTLFSGHALADTSADDLARLANMSLEELLNTRVSSVAGRPESRFTTPAAVTVLSGDDIRRSGFRSVAEALRMVPGMFVGHSSSDSWRIGSRGLTGSALTSTRYLVLVDGRLVYDPLASITFWDSVDVPIADLDRIEVVRGPGSTLWGVNAMNGVINIVTKTAQQTIGTLVQAGAGTNDEQSLLVRHGQAMGADGAWRAWAQYDHHGDFDGPDGQSRFDQWSVLRAGFRVDGTIDPTTRYTVQGDAYTHPQLMSSVVLPVPGRDREFQRITGDRTADGGNVLFRLKHDVDASNGSMLRAYFDHTLRDTPRFDARRNTADVEYRRWFDWGVRNNMIVGVQADWTSDAVTGPGVVFQPASRDWTTFNAFAQNTTEVVDDKVFLMVGTKLTRHSFVGLQTQPSVRLWWTPSDRQMWWAAVSRPVRVPSRFEENGLLVLQYVDQGRVTTGVPDGDIVPVGLGGNPDLRPERLLAWELGHRIQANDRWAFDTELFYNHYQRLLGVPPRIFGSFTDASSGATWGGDVSVSGRLNDRWRVEASYSHLHTRIDGDVLKYEETSTPTTQAQLRSYFDASDTLEINGGVYYASRITGDSTLPLDVPAYVRADLGVTWRPRAGLALSLWGQNLLDSGHPEASDAQVPRTVYAQLSWSR